MSWSIGFDTNWNRDIGYGVPAVCDHPKCNETINRGLSYVCGDGEKGCGLFFCGQHMKGSGPYQRCPKCSRYDKKPYKPKPDVPEWLRWKLRHKSWAQWRKENPKEVRSITASLRPLRAGRKEGKKSCP